MFTLKTAHLSDDRSTVTHTTAVLFGTEAEADAAADAQSPATVSEQVMSHPRGYWRRVAIDDNRWGVWESYPA